MIFRLAVKPLLALSAAIGAASVIVQFGPGAYEKIDWRGSQYDILKDIHSGYSLSYIKSKLGEPTISVDPEGVPGYQLLIYVRREHFVELVTSDRGRVAIYVVVSRSPDFSPTFDAPDGNQVTLQDRPLSKAATGSRGGLDPGAKPTDTKNSATIINNARNLVFVPPVSASSVAQFEESDPFYGSNAELGHGYVVGINDTCHEPGDNTMGSSRPGDGDYAGPVAAAPPFVERLRATLAANMYAEVADGNTFVVGDDGYFGPVGTSPSVDSSGAPEQRFPVGPTRDEVPRSAVKYDGTRAFSG